MNVWRCAEKKKKNNKERLKIRRDFFNFLNNKSLSLYCMTGHVVLYDRACCNVLQDMLFCMAGYVVEAN